MSESKPHSMLPLEVGEALDQIAAALPYMSDALGYVGFVRTHLEERAEEVEELGTALSRNVRRTRNLVEQLEAAQDALRKIEAYRVRPVDHPTLAFAEVVEIARAALDSNPAKRPE